MVAGGPDGRKGVERGTDSDTVRGADQGASRAGEQLHPLRGGMSRLSEVIEGILVGMGRESIEIDARMAAVLDTVLMALDSRRDLDEKITDVIRLWTYMAKTEADADAPTMARMELRRLRDAVDILDEAIRCRHGL